MGPCDREELDPIKETTRVGRVFRVRQGQAQGPSRPRRPVHQPRNKVKIKDFWNVCPLGNVNCSE